MIKVISFDLDGTLADENFDKLIWNSEIPKLFAAKYDLNLKTAKEKVFAEYQKEKGNPRWTDIGFWFDKFELQDWEKLLDDMKHHLKLFPEVIKVLKSLKKDFKLIIITQSEEKFMKLKLENLDSYFSNIFSTVHYFKKLEKDEEVYKRILTELNISSEEMIHIGNHWEFDYIIPKKLGITAYFLDREKKKSGEYIVHDLKEFKEKAFK